MVTQSQYSANSRVDPNYPLPSSLPPQDRERSPLTDGLARTTSKRRRASGSGPVARTPAENIPQPPAPEVPKAPPVSYRPPFEVENYPPPKNNYPSPSFAERARALTSNFNTVEPSETYTEPPPQPVKPVRRGSLNRPIGGVYSEIQQHKRDSYPPRNGPVSPRRFSNPTSPQQHQILTPSPPNQLHTSTISQQNTKPGNREPQPSTRRASAGLAQPPNKEWAPDRSPLQKLEVKLSDISKEEKRARVQEAEQRLRDSQAGKPRGNSAREGGFAGDRRLSKRTSTTTEEPRSQIPQQNAGRTHPVEMSPVSVTSNEYPPVASNPGEANAPRSYRRRESLSRGQNAQVESERDLAGQIRSINRDSLRKSSTRQKVSSQSDQQPERGVRFQGHDGIEDSDIYPPDVGLSERNGRKRSSGIEALARSDEAQSVQRDKFCRSSPSRKNRSNHNNVPAQQKALYHSKAEADHDDASAATYGGAQDPVPRGTVAGKSHAASYEVPPQTAAGIHARQAVNFGTESQDAVEVQSHRRHHLSSILHRGHDHAFENHERIGDRPKHLDEWRRAGTARLTAADFSSEIEPEPEQEQSAWWERSRTGSRRKSGRINNKEAQSPQWGVPNTIGKSSLHFSNQSSPKEEVKADSGKVRNVRTRRYVGEDEMARLRDESMSSHESHLTHFLHRSGHDRDRRLSSAYSYSCPDLAVHDPSHPDHICEPYLSKELTQSMRSIRIRPAPEIATFDPPLYLTCGPLLRYTGIKRDRLQMKARSGGSASVERETWRGSVMIVTADADSSYDPVPTLRLFSEPMDILPHPSHKKDADDDQDLPSEYIDPIAGLPKLSRTGKTVYVKPVDDLEHEKDLSRLENDDGLFEETRTAAVPTAYGTPDFRASTSNPKPVRRDGRAAKKGHHVKGIRLHAERGVTFWRFNLEVELGAEQTRIAYSINNSPSIGFWVPARGHSMNVMFHSCNGFSMSVK